MNIREWGQEIGVRSVWFLIRESGRYAITNPMATLGSIYIVDRFGWAGVRFLGRAGVTIVQSQIRLGVDLGKIALQEIGPAGIPQRLAVPFQRAGAAISRAAPVVARASRVGVAASPPALAAGAGLLLLLGPEMHWNLATDPNSGAYVTDDEGTIVATPYLDGPMGTGFL